MINEQEFLEALAREDAAKACLDALSPFFRARCDRTLIAVVSPWLYALCTAGGTPHGANVELRHELQGLQEPAEVVCERKVGRALNLPKQEEESLFEPRPRTDEDKLEAKMVRILVRLANLAIKRRGWVSRDLYITIDGRNRPFYGIGSNNRKLIKAIRSLSESGRWSSPMFRNKGKSKVPLFLGTVRGHKWVHLTLHHRTLKLSFPLAIIRQRRSLATIVAQMMEILTGLKVPPQAILFDKEYVKDHNLLAAVRQYADPRRVWVVAPEIRSPALERHLQRRWDDGSAAFQDQMEESMWMHCEEVPAKRENPAPKHYRVAIYTMDELRPDIEEETAPWVVYEDPDGVDSVVGIVFYSNFPVERIELDWFARIYARRWACESLFARHVMFMGRSQSELLGTRSFGYMAGFLVLAVYAHWVISRMGPAVVRRYTDDLSHRAFFAQVRGGIKRLLIKAD